MRPAAKRFIIGIDEVGRGSLAGPVVVGAVLLPSGFKLGRKGLRDSKKLTPAAREEWDAHIRSYPRIGCVLARVGPATIDRVNIARAANLAALRAFTRLVKDHGLTTKKFAVYLDGGLYLGNGRGRLPGKTIIKGDEKISAVALASIIAKVHRDRIMTGWAGKFPGYGFEVHKGYGTQMHRTALSKLGPSPAHRLTFLRNWDSMDRKHTHGRRTNKTSYTR